MSSLEEKLEGIEQKIKKLIAQNVQFKEICEDLLNVRRRLEKENGELKKKLVEQETEISDLTTRAQELKLAYQEDNEETKKRINQYIQDIDNSIEWLKQL